MLLNCASFRSNFSSLWNFCSTFCCCWMALLALLAEFHRVSFWNQWKWSHLVYSSNLLHNTTCQPHVACNRGKCCCNTTTPNSAVGSWLAAPLKIPKEYFKKTSNFKNIFSKFLNNCWMTRTIINRVFGISRQISSSTACANSNLCRIKQ